MDWIMEHWVEIGAGFGLIMGLARIVVKITPTPKDDKVLEGLVKLLKTLALHVDDLGPKDSRSEDKKEPK